MRSIRGKRTGRPREFDADRAVERAMQVFWQKGYDHTSLTDLTEAMGINPPSLYAAFGDKASLFRAALDRYQQLEATTYVNDALAQPTARAFVERLLRGTADNQTNVRHPGCLMVQGALIGRSNDSAIQREVRRRRARGETLVRERLVRAQREGDLPANTNPRALARFVVAVIRGMAVEAGAGATRKDLELIIRTAMQAWPG
jgi:AcrR family transcriptional regulator